MLYAFSNDFHNILFNFFDQNIVFFSISLFKKYRKLINSIAS